MDNAQLKALFDSQAAHYDTQWVRMAAMNNALYFLLESVFAELPEDARILCVGVATGTELINLAQKHPNWHFTAVEPSGAMLDVCKRRVEEAGLTGRCIFHEGYLHTLVSTFPTLEKHDAATCFLVSQFILDRVERAKFFCEIANQLKTGGILANSELSASNSAASYDELLKVWQYVMTKADVKPEMLERMRVAYAKDVAILPAAEVAAIIQAGGFEAPVPFFQAGLIHAWFSKREK